MESDSSIETAEQYLDDFARHLIHELKEVYRDKQARER
jgi:hypothetical protein